MHSLFNQNLDNHRQPSLHHGLRSPSHRYMHSSCLATCWPYVYHSQGFLWKGMTISSSICVLVVVVVVGLRLCPFFFCIVNSGYFYIHLPDTFWETKALELNLLWPCWRKEYRQNNGSGCACTRMPTVWCNSFHLSSLLRLFVVQLFKWCSLWQDDPEVPNQKLVPYTEFCTCDLLTYWLLPIYAYKGLLMIFGAFLAWETRKVNVSMIQLLFVIPGFWFNFFVQKDYKESSKYRWIHSQNFHSVSLLQQNVKVTPY